METDDFGKKPVYRKPMFHWTKLVSLPFLRASLVNPPETSFEMIGTTSGCVLFIVFSDLVQKKFGELHKIQMCPERWIFVDPVSIFDLLPQKLNIISTEETRTSIRSHYHQKKI